MDHDQKVVEIEGKGRGVVAARAFEKDEVVEVGYVLFVFEGFESLGRPELSAFEYAWGELNAVAVGLSPLYNHSDDPNVRLERHLDRGQIVVRALRAIRPGEELCHRYRCSLWFEAR